jgi:hypothetical protein
VKHDPGTHKGMHSVLSLKLGVTVVIGLELLSLACPGLGLGSDCCYIILVMPPYLCYGYLILLV